jgi:hypothetical protein
VGSLGFGGTVALGELSAETAQADWVGPGGVFMLGLGYGVSRTVVVGAYGEYGFASGGRDCNDSPAEEPSCKTSSFAVGPMLRYHLVQGLRFDPFLEVGVAYRKTTLDTGESQLDYSGLDLMRLAVNGDWYASRNLGVGASLGAAFGTYFDRASAPRSGSSEDAALYVNLSAGLHLAFDFPGR